LLLAAKNIPLKVQGGKRLTFALRLPRAKTMAFGAGMWVAKYGKD